MKLGGDLIASRLAIGQTSNDNFARPVTYLSMVEMLQIFAGEALVQFGKQWIRCWKWRRHVGARKEQAVARRIERHWAAKSGAVGGRISRRRIGQLYCQRIDVTPADPAAKPDKRGDDILDTLPRYRPTAPNEHKCYPIPRRFFLHC